MQGEILEGMVARMVPRNDLTSLLEKAERVSASLPTSRLQVRVHI